MRDVTSCADNLVLLGEMLEVAAEYVTRCEETLGQEDAFMVGLAHDQLHFLRKRLVKLEQRLSDLEVKLRPQAQASENTRPSESTRKETQTSEKTKKANSSS
jgi:hypothetical protein